ncbi:MAG: hypothetical protein ACE5G2_04325 [Candidatus Krumholzibacteriia bacterium]
MSPRERSLAALFAVLLLILGAGALVRRLYLPHRDALTAEIRRHERMVARNHQLEQQAESIRRQYEAVQGALASRLQPAGDGSNVLRALERIAQGRVQLLSVDPQFGRERRGRARIPVTIQLQGGLGPLGVFLLAVAQELGGEIASLTLSASGRPGGDVRCETTCVFSLVDDRADGM